MLLFSLFLGNFSGMQATQPMGIFQQNQPYGVQKNQVNQFTIMYTRKKDHDIILLYKVRKRYKTYMHLLYTCCEILTKNLCCKCSYANYMSSSQSEERTMVFTCE